MRSPMRDPDSPDAALDRLKLEIGRGLTDIAAGRVRDFDTRRIVERGRKLFAAGATVGTLRNEMVGPPRAEG
jgi:hypothetical protein